MEGLLLNDILKSIENINYKSLRNDNSIIFDTQNNKLVLIKVFLLLIILLLTYNN